MSKLWRKVSMKATKRRRTLPILKPNRQSSVNTNTSDSQRIWTNEAKQWWQGCPGNTGAVFPGWYFPPCPILPREILGNTFYFNYSIIFHIHKFRDSRIYAACLPFISHIANMFHTGSLRFMMWDIVQDQ